MPKDKFYCSLQEKEFQNPIHGSTPNFSSYILIEYPHPFPHSLNDSILPEIVVNHLITNFEYKKCRVLLIKDSQTSNLGIRVFLINSKVEDTKTRLIYINDYYELLTINSFEDVEKSILFVKEFYLVCTNGKKDKCCSKFGIPIYNKIKELGYSLFQCTHVGGDRYAPNILLMPHGLYYGQLDYSELDVFLTTNEKKEIYLNKFRGRSSFNFAEQSADYFLRTQISDLDFQSIQSVKSTIKGSYASVILMHLPTKIIYLVEMEEKESATPQFFTCSSNIASRLKYFELIRISQMRK